MMTWVWSPQTSHRKPGTTAHAWNPALGKWRQADPESLLGNQSKTARSMFAERPCLQKKKKKLRWRVREEGTWSWPLGLTHSCVDWLAQLFTYVYTCMHPTHTQKGNSEQNDSQTLPLSGNQVFKKIAYLKANYFMRPRHHPPIFGFFSYILQW